MLKKSLLTHLMVAAAGIGLLLPAAPVVAAEPTPVVAARQIGMDVVLDAGHVKGQYVNTQGAALEGATVIAGQRGIEVARTTTNANGQFRLALRPGIYDLTVGAKTETIRVWSADAAPPAARSTATLVEGSTVRGQNGPLIDPVAAAAIAIGTTGVVLGAVALDRANNNQSN